jgi:hypothetical protein
MICEKLAVFKLILLVLKKGFTKQDNYTCCMPCAMCIALVTNDDIIMMYGYE